MRFFAPIAAALAATAAAEWCNVDPTCLTDAQAEYLVNQEIIFLQHTNLTQAREIAYSIFSPDIQEFGDSINSLRNDTLGTVVEPNREVYVNDSLSEPGTPNIVTVDIVHNCHTIVWQWQFYGVAAIPNPPNPRLSGFTSIKVNDAGLIYYQYVEFNSLAWAENFGFTVIFPTTGPFAPQPAAKRSLSQRSIAQFFEA